MPKDEVPSRIPRFVKDRSIDRCLGKQSNETHSKPEEAGPLEKALDKFLLKVGSIIGTIVGYGFLVGGIGLAAYSAIWLFGGIFL